MDVADAEAVAEVSPSVGVAIDAEAEELAEERSLAALLASAARFLASSASFMASSAAVRCLIAVSLPSEVGGMANHCPGQFLTRSASTPIWTRLPAARRSTTSAEELLMARAPRRVASWLACDQLGRTRQW